MRLISECAAAGISHLNCCGVAILLFYRFSSFFFQDFKIDFLGKILLSGHPNFMLTTYAKYTLLLLGLTLHMTYGNLALFSSYA
jgi:hypothetical protein